MWNFFSVTRFHTLNRDFTLNEIREIETLLFKEPLIHPATTAEKMLLWSMDSCKMNQVGIN